MPGRALLAIVAALLAVVGVAAAAAFFASRDDATLEGDDGPGVARAAGERPAVAPGNVLLLYGDERLAGELRALAERAAGPPDPALEAAGQAVLVRRRPGQARPVVALTATRRLDASGPRDPALRTFVDRWLGRAP